MISTKLEFFPEETDKIRLLTDLIREGWEIMEIHSWQNIPNNGRTEFSFELNRKI